MAKQYRVLGSIGKGGFGTVYRAAIVGDRAAAPVAIKLLHEGKLPDGTLERFRDEARILRLAKDRTIVSVEPPMMLSGRWAVVMDYVDGCSASQLLDKDALPPGAAVELVGEVARALEALHKQPGPTGAPLELLHRDLKPGNIQITRNGEVRLLDFGFARAEFAAREAKTMFEIGGTSGYLAPERLVGMEGPEGDIFSLGVVLQVLVTADAPYHDLDLEEFDGDVLEVLKLAKHMQKRKPKKRPKALEIVERCRELRERIEGETLAQLAAREVPGFLLMDGDALTGKVLVEEPAKIPVRRRDDEEEGRSWFLVVAGVGVLVVGLGVLGLGTLAAGGAAAWWFF
jgi:serine/threonine protein kinase